MSVVEADWASWAEVGAMVTLRSFQAPIPYNQAGPASRICTRSRLACLGRKNGNKKLNGGRSFESFKIRTRFESNRHGMYNGADRRPYFLREFDLTLVGVIRNDG